MKKHSKAIVLSLIIIISLIFIISKIYKISLEKHYTCTITNIENNTIIGAYLNVSTSSFKYDDYSELIKDCYGNKINFSDLYIGETIYIYHENDNINYAAKIINIDFDNIYIQQSQLDYYSFLADNLEIKDINGNKIGISNLSIGDRIEIATEKLKANSIIPLKTLNGNIISDLYNIKKIKVIDKNLSEQEAIENRNMIATKRAVILKVNEDYLDVMSTEKSTDLFTVKYEKNNNLQFSKGQEILIYFNGFIDTLSPIKIKNVGKIEIMNE